jgi:hypothetical protein
MEMQSEKKSESLHNAGDFHVDSLSAKQDNSLSRINENESQATPRPLISVIRQPR